MIYVSGVQSSQCGVAGLCLEAWQPRQLPLLRAQVINHPAKVFDLSRVGSEIVFDFDFVSCRCNVGYDIL